MLPMKRIPVPERAEPFKVTVDKGFGEREFGHLSLFHDELWERVHEAIAQFVNDDGKVRIGEEIAEMEDADFVPDRTRLTGEYYLAWEYCYRIRTIYPEEGFFRRRRPTEENYYVRVMGHCLGRQAEDQANCDYLGLNVGFVWHPKQQTLSSVFDVSTTQI